jgi:hypothetical protein
VEEEEEGEGRSDDWGWGVKGFPEKIYRDMCD